MMELVGDALRNGALRFGIATKLWSKTDGAASSSPDEAPVQAPARPNAPAAAVVPAEYRLGAGDIVLTTAASRRFSAASRNSRAP